MSLQMNRSEVNEIMLRGDEFIRSLGYILPPFAYFSVDEMRDKKSQIASIIDCSLGWDITDYGQGRFDEVGLFLFTLRNGNPKNLKTGKGALYAEKLMISRKGQYSPMHRHNDKVEDIINRGGGKLIMELFGDSDRKCDRTKGVKVFTDGVERSLDPGEKLSLLPGQSVTLMPNIHWHAFWAEGADVLIGEVSNVNDDENDNFFEDSKITRFSGIKEDEKPLHLLVSDYKKFLLSAR